MRDKLFRKPFSQLFSRALAADARLADWGKNTGSERFAEWLPEQ